MLDLQAKETSSQEKRLGQAPQVSMWSRTGPAMLLGAFAIFLFKCAPFYWPLTLTAFLGYAATRIWKKKGLFLSWAALCYAAFLILRSGYEPLWTTALAGSIAISWLLIFLGGQDAESLAYSRETEILILEEERLRLEKELKGTRSSNSDEQRKSAAEKERLNALYSQSASALAQASQSLEASEKERAILNAKCGVLSQDICALKRNEAAFQNALEDAQAYSAELKNQLVELIAARRENPQEAVTDGQAEGALQIEQVKHQHALLREQFREKSDALDQARKELFRIENDFLALQKAWEEKKHEPSEIDSAVFRDLKSLEEECHEWESQVIILQEFISSLLLPKKRSRSKKNKDEQELLPDLIQSKIDQRTNIQS